MHTHTKRQARPDQRSHHANSSFLSSKPDRPGTVRVTLAPTQGFTLFVLVTVAGTACERKSQTCLALELTESEVGLVLQQSTAILLEQHGKDGTYLTTSQLQ